MKVGTFEAADIGSRLRAAREVLGLTQEGLAQAVDGSKPGIRDNEGGKNVPGGKVILGLVRLGINANWLLTGEGPMLLNPAAELGRLMAAARGEAKIQPLAQHMDMTAATLEAMERGERIADAETINDYVVMCGADPDVLFPARDRALVACGLLAAPTKPAETQAPINVKALSAIIEGLAKAGAPPGMLGQTAVRYYLDAIEQGLITADGVGDGDGKAAA